MKVIVLILKEFILKLSISLSLMVDIAALYLLYINVFSERLFVKNIISRSSMMEGETKGVLIENRNLRSVYLQSLHLVIDNKYIIKIYEDDINNSESIVLAPFSIKNVETKPRSCIDIDIEKIIDEEIYNGQYHLLLKTSNGKTQIKYGQRKKGFKADKTINPRDNYNAIVRSYTYKYNDIIIQPHFRYMCYLYEKGENNKLNLKNTLIITKTGLILNGDILGYNGLSKDFTSNKEILQLHIEQLISEIIGVENNDFIIHIEDLREKYNFIN